MGRSIHSFNIKLTFQIKTQPGWEMSINAFLVATLKNQMWHNFKHYWKVSIKEQNQMIFNITLKLDVYS